MNEREGGSTITKQPAACNLAQAIQCQKHNSDLRLNKDGSLSSHYPQSLVKTAAPLPPDRDVLQIVFCLVIVRPASFWEAHFNLRSFWMVCCTCTDEINFWWELKVSPCVGCRNTAGTQASVKRPKNTTDRRWGKEKCQLSKKIISTASKNLTWVCVNDRQVTQRGTKHYVLKGQHY